MESDKSKEEILNNFSSRFIGTIGTEGTENGGLLILEAMENFDEDWPGKSYKEFMKELGCRNALELAQKLDAKKVKIYRDENEFWRILPLCNEANAHVLDMIDSAIRRKKCGLPKGSSGNVIPLKFPDVHRAFERRQISLNEAMEIISGLNEAKNSKNLGPNEKNICQKPPPLIPLIVQEMMENVKKLALENPSNPGTKKEIAGGIFVESEENLGAKDGQKENNEKKKLEMEDNSKLDGGIEEHCERNEEDEEKGDEEVKKDRVENEKATTLALASVSEI